MDRQHLLINLLRQSEGRPVSYETIIDALALTNTDARNVVRQTVMNIRIAHKEARTQLRSVNGFGYVWLT